MATVTNNGKSVQPIARLVIQRSPVDPDCWEARITCDHHEDGIALLDELRPQGDPEVVEAALAIHDRQSDCGCARRLYWAWKHMRLGR